MTQISPESQDQDLFDKGSVETPPRPDPAKELREHAARNDMAERRRITQKLRAALTEDGFVLHYQPKIQLQTGLMRGAEAVIRLQHRRRGLITPNHFMPVAERSDIINEISAWMLHQACAEAVNWPKHLTVSLNISQRLLRSGKLVKYVIHALTRSGLPATRLELELSESMLIDDHEDTIFSLKAARALGVGVALDDFGAGYGSLSVLKRMPLTTLKLDRSVVTGLQSEQSETAILRAAIDTGHALGCTIVADGVETEKQCRWLNEMGCDEAQGTYFSPAVPAAELIGKLTG